jgi:predicted nucleic acid-binding protein
MKLMLDVNVVFDVLEERHPYYKHSSVMLSEVRYKKVEGVLPAHAVTTIYYMLAKHRDRQTANDKLDWLLANFEIAPVDKSVFLRARKLAIKDFEDAVVASLAEFAGCDYIVTRNAPDFEHALIPIITPEDFVSRYVG